MPAEVPVGSVLALASAVHNGLSLTPSILLVILAFKDLQIDAEGVKKSRCDTCAGVAGFDPEAATAAAGHLLQEA